MDTCQVKFDSAALGLTSPCPGSNMYFLINYDCVQSEQNQMPVLRLVVLFTFEITFRESIFSHLLFANPLSFSWSFSFSFPCRLASNDWN